MKFETTARCSIKVLFATLIAMMVSPLSASAWNSVGHRTVAELAWRKLDKNERRAVSDLLKQHPHYKQLLAANVPEGVDTDEWVFLTAAVWPDLVRPAKPGQPHKPDSITKYDLYPHAVGYPFLKHGETNRALLENFFIAQPDAEMVLSNSIATLKNRKASAHDRAVSLCWALHLFGDLHQPLHAANIVTKERPRGDRLGGNHIAIDPRSGKQINFHSLWDQLPGVNPSYKTVASLADELRADANLKPSAMPEYRKKTIAAWVQESFRDAVNVAYSKDVQYVHADDLESGKIAASEVPALKAEYIDDAQKIARRRLVLAGERLKDELKRAF